MSFSGDHHVLIPVPPDSHCLTGMPRGDGSQASVYRRLSLFTAKPSSHSRGLNNHLMRFGSENMRNHMLNLRGMLGRGGNHHRGVFARNRNGSLSFKVEMVLPTEPDLTLKAVGGFLESSIDIPAADKIRLGMNYVATDLAFQSENPTTLLI